MDDFDGDAAERRGLRRSLREQQVEWVLEGPSAASGAWDGLSSGKSSVHPSRRVTGFVTAPAAAQIRFPLCASAPAFFASLGGLHRRNPTTRPAGMGTKADFRIVHFVMLVHQ